MSSSGTLLAAWVFCAATLLAIAFQLALAAGAPWGRLALGGRYPGRLPPALRLAEVVQALLLAAMGWVVLAHAGALGAVGPLGWSWPIWMVVSISALSLAMNLISPSPGERALWAPVALVMTASSGIVALG